MKDNRSHLEEIARESVQRNGLKALSFRTLADQIGIKSSSVHYYFPEKSDLAKTLIEGYSEELFISLRTIEAQKGSLKKKISAFIAIFEVLAKNDQFCLCGMLAAEVEHLSADNQVLLAKAFTDIERWLIQTIETNRSELNTTLTPMQFARSILSGIEGALLIDRVMGNTRRIKVQKDLILTQMR